jgi:hypothetical protein
MGLRKNKSILDQAVDQYVDQVKPHVDAAVATAKEKGGPVLADAKAKAGPALADAKAKAGPAIAAGAAIAAEKVASGAAVAAEKAAGAAEAAADKVSDVAQPKKKKGSKLKKLLVLTGLAAGAAFVAKKLQGGKQSDNWQSSYTPTPAPAPAHAARPTDDEAGATPSEAISDQAESAHPVTTPDDPAEVVDLDDPK